MNDLVREGYDAIAELYAAQRDRFKNDRYLRRFAELLPGGARVLDVGCGPGVPVGSFLLQRGFSVYGLDISPRQVEQARALNPGATFEVRDMLDLRPGEFAVDGIVSLYAIFHVAREHHGAVLKTMRSYLQTGGVLLVSLGVSEWEGTEEFHGVQMFWSHYGIESYRDLLAAAGFEIDLAEVDTSGGENHLMVIARAVRQRREDE